MTDTPKVAAARIAVERERAQLLVTVREIQLRLQPRTLAGEAWEKAKIKGADMAEEAVDAVKARPLAVGGVAAALTMFLAREPIKDAAVKIYDAMTSSRAPKTPRTALKKQPSPERGSPSKPRPDKPRPASRKRAPAKTESRT